LFSQVFILSNKEKLTPGDKIKLRELVELLEKQQVGRLIPYPYQGWMVYHYVGPEQFIACQEARVLRASTKDRIEKLIQDENEKT
jgi:hypothetical protein